MIMDKRTAGILFPIFSLPSPYGIGTLGLEAYRFADCLKAAGQTYWQILPIGPTGYGDSPYQSFSAYAGNPYFIDPDTLKKEGLLKEGEAEKFRFGEREDEVDYSLLYKNRGKLLYLAFNRFEPDAAYREFLEKSADWLPGYADFMVRKEGGPEAFYFFLQYEFYRQWSALKQYANENGIRIIGDIPIYVAMDSADVEADRRLFQFDRNGKPSAVAGCPPDAFAEKGQLWGNPLYDWDYHRETGFAWWIKRMKHCFELYDVVRVDHFRGFDEYYSIPYGAPDASQGTWRKGPGMELFRALRESLGERPIIAEDLGFLTNSVKELVRESGYPGMKVLEFGFDSRETGDYRPATWPENCVAYTGTHDNQTLKSWLPELTPADCKAAAAYLGKTVKELFAEDYVLDFIRLTMESKANTVVIPMQDYMRLPGSARINKPATMGGNWRFRFTNALFSDKVWEEIPVLTKECGRERR